MSFETQDNTNKIYPSIKQNFIFEATRVEHERAPSTRVRARACVYV